MGGRCWRGVSLEAWPAPYPCRHVAPSSAAPSSLPLLRPGLRGLQTPEAQGWGLGAQLRRPIWALGLSKEGGDGEAEEDDEEDASASCCLSWRGRPG